MKQSRYSDNIKIKKYSCYSRYMSIIVLMMLTCFFSCSHDKKQMTDAISDRAQFAVLHADSVTTLISDSGIVRYRIKTKQWDVYDKATPKHWEFPQGVYLDKFNEDLKVEASLVADYAYYNEDEQIWELDGNVHALNLEGEQFETQQLFWSQKSERVYSDSVIKITRATSIIVGIGFESNQTMSKYTINHPTGVFPIKDEE